MLINDSEKSKIDFYLKTKIAHEKAMASNTDFTTKQYDQIQEKLNKESFKIKLTPNISKTLVVDKAKFSANALSRCAKRSGDPTRCSTTPAFSKILYGLLQCSYRRSGITPCPEDSYT